MSIVFLSSSRLWNQLDKKTISIVHKNPIIFLCILYYSITIVVCLFVCLAVYPLLGYAHLECQMELS